MVKFTGRGGDHKARTLKNNAERNVGNGDTAHRNWGVQPRSNRPDDVGLPMGGSDRPGRSSRP